MEMAIIIIIISIYSIYLVSSRFNLLDLVVVRVRVVVVVVVVVDSWVVIESRYIRVDFSL